ARVDCRWNYSHYPGGQDPVGWGTVIGDAVHCAVEEASGNAWPTAVVAASPSTTTGAQTLVAIAQQQPVAAVKPLPPVTNTFGEMLRAINDNVSTIEVSLFPTVTAPWSPKIGVLWEVHLCGGLVIDSPSEDLVLSDDDDEE
uniref:Uncharacterized protein n=1 Tax=Romanomermis culicivorax TaxID=13658 RepID=A0A915L5M6_ROMCU